MKIYIIKRKGANSFGNLCAFLGKELYGDETILVGSFFLKRKDAKLALKHCVQFPENYEILKLELKNEKHKHNGI
jgi:hypothetical protein